jgi:putative Mn2+ efflux pump MntP
MGLSPTTGPWGRNQKWEEQPMRKSLEICGAVAAVVLIGFGVAVVVMGINGNDTVKSSISQEEIVGTPDMSPAAIKAEVHEAGLSAKIGSLPSCDVAEKAIDNGDNARCFAQYLRIHTLLATGGYTYSQMGRFEAKPDTPKSELAPGGGTENEKFAAIDPETGAPADNAQREIWVTATALSTALNASYMANQLSIFGIVVGIALLLIGIGFAVLVLTGAVRDPHSALRAFRRSGRGAPAPA